MVGEEKQDCNPNERVVMTNWVFSTKHWLQIGIPTYESKEKE